MEAQPLLWETGGPDVGPPGNGAGRPPTNGTPTSNDAADAIQSLTGRLRWLVLDALRERGAEGATAEELEHATGLSGSTVRPRLIELRRKGLVMDSTRTRPTASGRRAVVWITTL